MNQPSNKGIREGEEGEEQGDWRESTLVGLVKILSKGFFLFLEILSKGKEGSVPAAAATGWGERGWEGEVRERGAGSGAGGLMLTLFCFATVRGDARLPASPP
jgi:hypothetical protein